MAELAVAVVFDLEANELTVNGQPFPWEFVELQPVFEKRGGYLVPGVQLTLLGASLEVLSAHTGEAETRG